LRNPFLGDSIYHWITRKYIWSLLSLVRLQTVLVSEDRSYWSWCGTHPHPLCRLQPMNLFFSSPVPCLLHTWQLQRSNKTTTFCTLFSLLRSKATAKLSTLKAFISIIYKLHLRHASLRHVISSEKSTDTNQCIEELWSATVHSGRSRSVFFHLQRSSFHADNLASALLRWCPTWVSRPLVLRPTSAIDSAVCTASTPPIQVCVVVCQVTGYWPAENSEGS